jgi:arylsulfatase A-like enzyme
MMNSENNASHGNAIHRSSTMGWELFGRAAVRKGDYKLVHIEAAMGGRDYGKWQLYNLVQDPGEIHDLSDSHSDKVEELLAIWEEYCRETGVVWGAPIKFVGKLWDGPREDVIGGNMLTHTQAWMNVADGKTLAA